MSLATDFLLFGAFTFPEVLRFFASFFFGHIVYLSMLFVVLSSAAEKLMLPSGKICHGFWRFVISQRILDSAIGSHSDS
jgi:hypothetical protein